MIYAGANFSQIGIHGRFGLAAIGSAGDVLPWAPRANGAVHTLLALGRNVHADGEFTQISVGDTPATRKGLAAIDIDGPLSSWDPDANGPVYSLGLGEGLIQAGGAFTQVGDRLAGGFATLAP